MEKKFTLKRVLRFPWHSILFTLYPIAALLSHNIGEVNIEASFRSFAISITTMLALLIVSSLLWQNWQKAGLVTTLAVLFFFSYGHIYSSLKTVIPDFLVVRHRYLAPVLLGMLGLGVWWVIRKRQRISIATSFLNLMSALVLIIPIYQLASFGISERVNERGSAAPSTYGASLPTDRVPPDVYYIILDAYGRADVLQYVLGYDNQPFLSTLTSMGFYVANCSQSNYPGTTLSLASSLNMNYLTELSPEIVPENTDRSPLYRLMRYSMVGKIFDSLGYSTVAFETGYNWSQMKQYDYYMSPSYGLYRSLNGFEGLLLQESALSLLEDAGLIKNEAALTDSEMIYERTMYVLETLEDMSSIPSPKFVFVHLIIPHSPFTFGPDGEFLVIARSTKPGEDYEVDDYFRGYYNQLVYINKRIPQILLSLIENSSTPPIIILQGDHGPGYVSEVERLGILNAYYMPGEHPDFFDTITPVNSFRVVLNAYFGTEYELLKDVSYSSSRYKTPYDFKQIPNNCQSQ